HQEHVAAVVAHPVVAVRRTAQVVARVVAHHVDRTMVVVMEALAAGPDVARRRGRTVVDHDRARVVTMARTVIGAVVATVMVLPGRAAMVAAVMAAIVPAVVATVPAMAVAGTGGFGGGHRGTEAQQGGDGQGDQLSALHWGGSRWL